MVKKSIPVFHPWAVAKPDAKAQDFLLQQGAVIYLAGNTSPYVIMGEAVVHAAEPEEEDTSRDPHG